MYKFLNGYKINIYGKCIGEDIIILEISDLFFLKEIMLMNKLL